MPKRNANISTARTQTPARTRTRTRTFSKTEVGGAGVRVWGWRGLKGSSCWELGHLAQPPPDRTLCHFVALNQFSGKAHPAEQHFHHFHFHLFLFLFLFLNLNCVSSFYSIFYFYFDFCMNGLDFAAFSFWRNGIRNPDPDPDPDAVQSGQAAT